MASKPTEYTIHYADGTTLTMPFSESLAVGDTWKDSVALWRVVRIKPAAPGEPVDVWVEPVRE